MLVYAWDLMRWDHTTRFDSDDSPDLLGLMARILVDSTTMLLRHQLGRDYIRYKTQLKGIRGKICFSESLGFIGRKENKLVCQFNHLDIDTSRNQIIKSTLEKLVNDPRLISNNPNSAARLENDIRRAIRDMDGVRSIKVSNELFSQVQLGRNDRYYALPLQICALIHRLRMPTQTAGNNLLTELVQNELVFGELFEKFVRNFYSYTIGDSYMVKAEQLNWPLEEHNRYMPGMLTDISLVRREYPHDRVIIDCKYYKEAFASKRGWAPKFRSENLYQMYAYLRTQEDHSPEHRRSQGVLLYPTVNNPIDETFSLQGHTIKVVTVDLSDEWQQIENWLTNMIGTFHVI